MATTKKAVKFYADPAVEAHLESIPTQLRTNWINTALTAAIKREKSAPKSAGSELSDLHKWLQEQAIDAPPLYEALADMLHDYLSSR